MKQHITEAIGRLGQNGDVVSANDIADLAGLFKDVSEEKCECLINDMNAVFTSVLSVERLESFDGEIVTPATLAILMQSPNILAQRAGNVYTITDEDSGETYKVCVAQVELVNKNVCNYATISTVKVPSVRDSAVGVTASAAVDNINAATID